MTSPIEPGELRRLLDEVAAGPTTGTFDDVFRRAHRQRRSFRTGLVVATVVLVAAAIVVPMLVVSGNTPRQRVTTSPSPSLSPSPTASPSLAAHANPYGLFGHWRVIAAGERPGTSLTLGAGLTLYRTCGALYGSWRADFGADFIGDVYGGAGACFHDQQSFSAPWLSQAVGFRIAGADRLLLNAEDMVLARLTPIGHQSSPARIPAASTFPAVQRALVQTPAPLPSGVSPASLSEMLGRWHAVGPDPGSPGGYVEFKDNATWIGSDGCNGYGGGLVVGADGQVLTTTRPNGLVECQISPAPLWAEHVGRAAIEGNQLLLYDSTGTLLGRLVRQLTARVIGRFIAYVGVDTHGHPLTGAISVRLGSAHGESVTDGSARHGHFAMTVPVGSYVFVGSTNGFPAFACTSNQGQPTTLSAGETAHVTVTCNGK